MNENSTEYVMVYRGATIGKTRNNVVLPIFYGKGSGSGGLACIGGSSGNGYLLHLISVFIAFTHTKWLKICFSKNGLQKSDLDISYINANLLTFISRS